MHTYSWPLVTTNDCISKQMTSGKVSTSARWWVLYVIHGRRLEVFSDEWFQIVLIIIVNIYVYRRRHWPCLRAAVSHKIRTTQKITVLFTSQSIMGFLWRKQTLLGEHARPEGSKINISTVHIRTLLNYNTSLGCCNTIILTEMIQLN